MSEPATIAYSVDILAAKQPNQPQEKRTVAVLATSIQDCAIKVAVAYPAWEITAQRKVFTIDIQ